jgi:CBS domain-containing protein
MLKVKDVMTTPVISVFPTSLVEDALEKMDRHRITGLPVVDKTNRVVGVISEFDTLLLLLRERDAYGPFAPVSLFMTMDVISIDADETVIELAHTFLARAVRRLPVLDRGELAGIVTRRDLARLIRERRKDLALAPWDELVISETK